MSGIKRNLAPKIQKLLYIFPVVVILGARQVGKTTLSKDLFPTWKYFDLEKPDDFELIHRSPALFFQYYPEHVILDEAQEYPAIFKILRGIVDAHPEQKGRFVITGSSSPELLKEASETLAGRVGIVELGTLKANEYYEKPLSDFYQLFTTKLSTDRVVCGTPPLSSMQLKDIWFKGGYPAPLLATDFIYHSQWMENYRNTYINRDIAKLFPRLNKMAYQRFLSILSKLSGTILNRSTIASAIEVSEKTIRDYLHIAEGTFLWRSLPSYEKNIMKAVIKMPKGIIRDTGLLHYLAHIHSMDELLEDPLVGTSFEAFVIEELLKGLEATFVTHWSAYYYRTRKGAEIDIILEGPFGILPIEIKSGTTTVGLKQITALIQFIEENQLKLGLVINNSARVEWITEKVVQIPVGYL